MDVDVSQYLGKGDAVYNSFSSIKKKYDATAWQQFYQILEHTDHLKTHTDHLSGYGLEYDYSRQYQTPNPSFFYQYRDGLSGDMKRMYLSYITEQLEGYEMAGDAVDQIDALASVDLVGLWLGRHTQAIRFVTLNVDLPTLENCVNQLVDPSASSWIVDKMSEWESLFKNMRLAVDYVNNKFLMPVGMECVHALDWHLVLGKLKEMSLITLPQFEFFTRVVNGDFNLNIQDSNYQFYMKINHVKFVFNKGCEMSVKLYTDFRVELQ